MITTIEFLEKLQDIYGWTIEACVVTTGIVTYVWKRWRDSQRAKTNQERQSTDTHNKINVIYSELTPNHGSSLKDKVSRIDNGLMENTKVTRENSEMLKIVTARQQWILDMQDTPIFESDANGLCIWVNDAYMTLVKTTKEDILGHVWKNCIHEEDRERVVDEWDHAVRDKRSSHTAFRLAAKDGTLQEVECYATKHKDNGYTGKLKVKY
jgi:PAS domain S-box-containing protein